MPNKAPRPAESPLAQSSNAVWRVTLIDRPFVTGFWFALGAMLAVVMVSVVASIVTTLFFASLFSGLSRGF